MVLVWAGNDPSGGAGLVADAAALLSHGCRPCPVVTAVTVQDTCGLSALNPVAASLVEQQARTVLADLPIAAIKIGVVGSIDNAQAIGRVLADHRDIPVVLDPVLRAGGGGDLAAAGMVEALMEHLLPQVTVTTPNADEARRLVPLATDMDAQAAMLLATGCSHVLLTGGDEPGDQVVNRLYSAGDEGCEYHWPRLSGSYHGSGCTMAAALAGLLAQRVVLNEAVAAAQSYTWQTLRHAVGVGRGQQLPDRMYWMRDPAIDETERVDL